MNKKGLELTMTFLVTLILGMVLFVYGLNFLYKMYNGAKEIPVMPPVEYCTSSERICVEGNSKTIERNNFGNFEIKLMNVLEDQNFLITVTLSDPPGIRKDNSPISSSSSMPKIIPKERTLRIKQNEDESILFGIEIPDDAVSGTYTLNIHAKSQDGKSYSNVQKFYVNVP